MCEREGLRLTEMTRHPLHPPFSLPPLPCPGGRFPPAPPPPHGLTGLYPEFRVSQKRALQMLFISTAFRYDTDEENIDPSWGAVRAGLAPSPRAEVLWGPGFLPHPKALHVQRVAVFPPSLSQCLR